MSDKPDKAARQLSPVAQRYILHWGAMGTRWGINRTVAQIHALLYLAPEPLAAEQIATTLSVARSNVSTSLRELKAWGLVRVVQVLGDRRDHFQTIKDPWQMFELVLAERKRREVDPTLEVLRSSVAELDGTPAADPHLRQQLGSMLEFFESTNSWYEELRRLPTSALRRLMKMGTKVRKLVEPVKAKK